ncbi:hypothetical protein BS47DRAFT_1344167 [Hydnum rufescens UP504]|uniref:Uncharacterized protein n=1 Tax=Hydnum rufescens UP504 TaxID=1448309 RepID=A0A9P6AZ96_9AGAM|nr:hypothetical protein BS47DRAFT_1344167 [Hydnum rufescens UP504]
MAFNVYMAANMATSRFNWKNIDANGQFVNERKRSHEPGYPTPVNSLAHYADVQDSGPNPDDAGCHVSKRQRVVVDLSIHPPRRSWMDTVMRPQPITPPTPTTSRRLRRGCFVRTKPSVGSPNRYRWKVAEDIPAIQYPAAKDANEAIRPSVEPLFGIPRSAIYHDQRLRLLNESDGDDSESESDSEYDHAYTQESEEIRAKIEYYQQAIMSYERLGKIRAWSERTWLEGNVAPQFDSKEALLLGELSTVDFFDVPLAVEDSWDKLVFPKWTAA